MQSSVCCADKSRHDLLLRLLGVLQDIISWSVDPAAMSLQPAVNHRVGLTAVSREADAG